jgi:hypothetical protein
LECLVHELTSLLISRHKVLKQVSSINMTCVRCNLASWPLGK